MKKTISILIISLLCCMTTNIHAAFIIDGDDRDEIIIRDNLLSTTEHERSILYVECTICRVTNTVELSFAGIGDVDIYIEDKSGKIITHRQCSETIGYIAIPVSNGQGTYRIYIESGIYSGEGYFSVY